MAYSNERCLLAVVGDTVQLLCVVRMSNVTPRASDRIELLETFLRIVDSGNLSAAARLLGTTQPTVSRRLQALEQWFGAELLRRTTHTMQLTDDGRRLYQHARIVLDHWQEMSDDLLETTEAPSGHLRVLVPHALGQQHLLAALNQFMDRYPGVDIEWILSDRRADFATENFDCAVQVGQISDPSVVAILLAEIPRIVVGGGPWRDCHTPQQLRAAPWLALNTFYRNEVGLTHRESGELCRFPITPRLSTDNLYVLREGITRGRGIGILSAWLANQAIDAGQLYHLAPHWQAPPLPVYLVYPWARFYPARLVSFLSVFRNSLVNAGGLSAIQK